MPTQLLSSLIPKGWKVVKNSTHVERSWFEDSTHENGSYYCTCVDCGRSFVGHKRRVQCKVCATDPCIEGTGEAHG